MQVGEVTHLGSGSAGKCEENISVKRIISQFFSPFLKWLYLRCGLTPGLQILMDDSV